MALKQRVRVRTEEEEDRVKFPERARFSVAPRKKMTQFLNLPQGALLFNKLSFFDGPSSALNLLQNRPCPYIGRNVQFQRCCVVQSSLQDYKVVDHVESPCKYKTSLYDGEDSDMLPHIQTLRNLPKNELLGKVAMVRFDSAILLREELNQRTESGSRALLTIQHLYEAGAKIILVSDWNKKINPELFDTETTADSLSSVLQLKVVPLQCISCKIPLKAEDLDKANIFLLDNLSEFKEEIANCSNFAKLLSSMIDIFVNDSFSHSHKILASTVGVARFCHANVAGFHFEHCLHRLKRAVEINRKPHVVIIGGGNLSNKVNALRFLASRCDGLLFAGMMSFQIMQALGLSVPLKLVEHGSHKEDLDIVKYANDSNIPILYPKDFWCKNDSLPEQLEILPAHGILDGWVPVDLGPESLDEMNSLLTQCKKITWIGSLKFRSSSHCADGESRLARMLNKLGQRDCDITVVGDMACKALMKDLSCISGINMIENASVVWEFLKGRKLHGVMALDRAYPFKIDWSSVYGDTSQPLVVDIGSGNGLFLLGMARRRHDLNFLGLEMNKKLVRRCLDSVSQSGIKNGFFVATNATSTFRSIVSSYPGKLVLVSIQCPNPDFNEPEHRWRMVQKSLVEAIADLLSGDGKVFLQSDIEAVALRMKKEFLKHGKGKLSSMMEDVNDNDQGWLEENPFGVRSDWEQHVIDRGAPMYRTMLAKSTSV